MQKRVVRRLPRLITVSSSSANDICAQMGARPSQLAVVPVGVDTARFRPMPEVARVPGRIMTTASADVPLKGLLPLIEAVAKVRTERHAELVVVGQPRQGSEVPAAIARLGLEGSVHLAGAVEDRRMVELYAEAEVAVVPSLYEGFSLPAIEAMACGVPLVATTGGALPEVVGTDGETALLVPPGDPGALAGAIGRMLDDAELRARIGPAGRTRVLHRFTWQATARATVAQYRRALADARGSRADGRGSRAGAGGSSVGAGGRRGEPTC
jgi:glycosyltransferase involved in cell wall biosynthesis